MLLFGLGFFLMGRVAFLCRIVSSAILEGFAALQNKLFPLLSACFPIFICDSKPCWNGSLRHLFLSICQNKLFYREDVIFFHASLLPFFVFMLWGLWGWYHVLQKKKKMLPAYYVDYVWVFSNLLDPISCSAKPPYGSELQDTFHTPHSWRERLLLWEYFPSAI